jgi:phosphate starvation-inducible PhoH-like protein
MLDLLGDADRHLRQVENHFPGVQFVARGDEISLTGANSEVDDARRVFDELMIIVQ